MSILKSIPRPENDNDFETLCKKLFSEFWQDPNIKKNGRNGQAQQGVDIYSKPRGSDSWYGIQCKAGLKRSEKGLTTREVDNEIKNALQFKPALKKLYFATTAPKDAGIEEYIRIKSSNNIKKGLFEIDIFSWPDIEDLIRENPKTYYWYVNEINQVSQKSIELTFDDGSTSLVYKPKFEKLSVHYKQAIIPVGYTPPYIHFPTTDGIIGPPKFLYYCKNFAYCKLKLRLKNTGNTILENLTIRLQFNSRITSLSLSNTSGTTNTPINYKESNIFIDHDKYIVKIVPPNLILVQDNDFLSDSIYFKPHYEEKEVQIHWTILSKDFKQEGTLIALLEPTIVHKAEEVLVEDPFKVGIKYLDIDDYCEGSG